MAAQVSDGDTIKFNALGLGMAVKPSRIMGPRVWVSNVSGIDVHASHLGEDVWVQNPHDMPIDVRIRFGFQGPPPPSR